MSAEDYHPYFPTGAVVYGVVGTRYWYQLCTRHSFPDWLSSEVVGRARGAVTVSHEILYI